MAQIIKHRRGSIDALSGATAKKGELVMATGSVGNMQGPWIFVGETEGSAGAFRGLSKVYQGTSAPNLTGGEYGSTLNGTPFYASSNQTLYILSNAGNVAMDLTGNIEGNVISGVTINNLTGSTVTVTGLTDNRLVVVGANGLLEDSIDLTFDGTKLQIGQGKFEVDAATGDLRTKGSIIMKGNITIGDNLTGDTINVNGQISSSLIPSGSNVFDLGSSSNAWKDLYVSGTAYIDILQAQQVNFSDLGILNDLTVSGNTYLGGTLDVTGNTTFNADVTITGLTDNRIVIVGTSGILEDDANFTFDGTELNVGEGNFTVQQGSGNVDTAGTLNVGGATTLESTLTVTGSATLKDNLSVSGTTTVSGATTLQDILTVNSTSQLKGAVGMNSTLVVTGSATLKDNLSVSGTTTVSGATTLQDTLTVNSTSELKGAVGINSTLVVTGSATLKDNLSVSGTTTVSGETTLQDTLTVNSTSELKGAVGINSTLDVTGSAQFKGTINVDGEATLSSAIVEDLTQDRIVGVGAGGSLVDYSGLTYNGTTLTVGGTTQLNGDLTVSGNFTVLGSATEIHISSSVIELDDNIIRLNAYSPFERYAGFEVIDSGSSGVSASMVWDSLNDYWLFVSSSGQSSKFIGTTAGTYGSEVSLTTNNFPIATDANTIGDSLLTMISSGTTLAFNTNKFTVNSADGATLIAGNVTLSAAGGADAGTNSSAIIFRNSSNVLGYVSTTETTDVLDGVLGYKNSNGALIFSTVIDGGDY